MTLQMLHSHAPGRVPGLPAESDYQCRPRRRHDAGTRPALVVLHGAGQVGKSVLGAPALVPGQYRFYRNLARLLGSPLISHDVGGPSTWANDVVKDAVEKVVDYAESAAMAGVAGVIIACVSMGKASAVRFAKSSPDRVRAIVASIGLSSVDDVYQNGLGFGFPGYRAAIGTANGVTFPTPLPAGVDAIAYPEDIGEVSVLDYVADDDPICRPAKTDALSALCAPGSEVHRIGAYGHSDAAVQAAADRLGYTYQWLLREGALAA